ncbi:hypothetical protein NL676_030980 [Syzygium grande]|nr:hypothetical protein NL676_030980 [Syzygium grande]
MMTTMMIGFYLSLPPSLSLSYVSACPSPPPPGRRTCGVIPRAGSSPPPRSRPPMRSWPPGPAASRSRDRTAGDGGAGDRAGAAKRGNIETGVGWGGPRGASGVVERKGRGKVPTWSGAANFLLVFRALSPSLEVAAVPLFFFNLLPSLF